MISGSLFFEKSLSPQTANTQNSYGPDIRYRTTHDKQRTTATLLFHGNGLAVHIIHILKHCKFRGASYAGDSSPDGSGGIYYERAYKKKTTLSLPPPPVTIVANELST